MPNDDTFWLAAKTFFRHWQLYFLALLRGWYWQTNKHRVFFTSSKSPDKGRIERPTVEKKHSLKKFFLMMGAWLAVITTVVVGSIIYDQNKTSDYDALAVPYIEAAVLEISQWDTEKTRVLMAPEVSATISEDKFSQTLALFSRLGTLQSVATPKFQEVHNDTQTDFGTQTLIEYEVDAKYEHGEALLNVKLLARDGSFQLYHFNLSSEVLAN